MEKLWWNLYQWPIIGVVWVKVCDEKQKHPQNRFWEILDQGQIGMSSPFFYFTVVFLWACGWAVAVPTESNKPKQHNHTQACEKSINSIIMENQDVQYQADKSFKNLFVLTCSKLLTKQNATKHQTKKYNIYMKMNPLPFMASLTLRTQVLLIIREIRTTERLARERRKHSDSAAWGERETIGEGRLMFKKKKRVFVLVLFFKIKKVDLVCLDTTEFRIFIWYYLVGLNGEKWDL